MKSTLGLGLALLVAGCTTYITSEKVDTTNLQALQGLKQIQTSTKPEGDVNPIRVDAIKETAMTVGAQGALALRSKQIDDVLAKDSSLLNQAFNFTPLMLPNNVLPPVLVEGDTILNLQDNQTIRIADKTYTIVQQAKFITVPPTWRDYLWMDFPKPEQPDKSMLPKNADEEALWRDDVELGWRQGIIQADHIFSENVGRLKRDYLGIALYRQLLDQKMINTPFVATTSLGVTGGGDTLTINDQVQRITNLPQLDPDSGNWKPAVAQPVN
jgi:defect-in-organelle-trafficking protein DotC